MAHGRRGNRTGRRCCRGARAHGDESSGSRRAGRGGGVPPTVGCVDGRASAAIRPGVGHGSGPPARGRARRSARLTGSGRRDRGRRSAACPSRATQRTDRGGCETRTRRAGSAAASREAARVTRRATGPGHLSPGLVGRGPRRSVRGTGRRSPGGFQSGAFGSAGLGSSAVRLAPRRSGDRDHRRARARRHRVCGWQSICISPIRFPKTTGFSGVGARRRPPSHSGTSTAGPS